MLIKVGERSVRVKQILKNCLFNHKIWVNSEIRTFALSKCVCVWGGGGTNTRVPPFSCANGSVPLNTTRRVCESWMPPGGNKVKIWQNLQVLHFDPAPPQGACDVSEVVATLRLTYSKSLVIVGLPKLYFTFCKQDGITDKQTNGKTDTWTIRLLDDASADGYIFVFIPLGHF